MGYPLKKFEEFPNLIMGRFSKRIAASYIVNGLEHIHGGTEDPNEKLVSETFELITSGKDHPYTWQIEKMSDPQFIYSSVMRHQIIDEIVRQISRNQRREVREKVALVLEELVSNAIYHSYKKKDGTDKYGRRQGVELTENERISVEFSSGKSGVVLSVLDAGGTFPFTSVKESFNRCYLQTPENMIQGKESGAGIGLYLVFESATHLRIDRYKEKSTRISCLIQDSRNTDPNYFSFNFFDWRTDAAK